MTDPTVSEATDASATEPIVVPADTTVVDAPAVVTDPASSDTWQDGDPVVPTPVDAPEGSTATGTVHGDTNVDVPVVPSSVDGTVGYQTVGEQDAVVDNAALNAQAAEQASTTDQGFITRGGTKDDSQGTPAGLDKTTPDNVHTDGGPTVFTDAEIDRLESLNLEAFEEGVRAKLDDLEATDSDLEALRGRHSSADLSGDTSPQTAPDSGDSPASA